MLVVGVTTGAIYGLLALGFTLVFNCTNVLNFSQGEFVMIGAVSGAILLGTGKVPYPIAAVLVALAGAGVGMAVERLAVRPIQKRHGSPIIPIMGTLAFAIMVSNATRLVVGTQERYMKPLVAGQLTVIGITVPWQNVVILAAALIMVTGLWLFLTRTMTGMGLRAMGIQRDAASLMGVNLDRMQVLSFALSASVAVLGGLLIAPILPASPYMGLPLAVKGFIAGVVGGLTDPFTAFLGGIAMGLLEVILAGYVSSSLTEIATFVILPVMLLVRPKGLFGTQG